MPGPYMTVHYVDPLKHVRDYAIAGAVQGVLWPLLWAAFNSGSHSVFIWWSHIVALPVMLFVSWATAGQCNGFMIEGDHQRTAEKRFFRWYCRTHLPTCVGVAIYLLCRYMMF